MCARRFLIFVFVLTLLVVAAGFALFQWGGDVLLKQATPKGHFEAAAAGGAPDYAKLEAWLAHPGLSNSPSNWRPDGSGGFTAVFARTATFYIHPTTYLNTDRWNAPLNPGGDAVERDRLFVQSQASAFGDNSEIWAPKYRQAAYGAFLLRSEDAEKALALAYRDVRAAFDMFLAAQPKGRPIVLAGHSQGALHLMHLLQERHSQLKGRLVAAYLIGWPISTVADLPSLGFPACRSRDQAGCILSWMSFRDPANPGWMLDQWEESAGPAGVKRRRNDILCVNPLTGTVNGSAPPGRNYGTLVPSADLRSATILPKAVGAHCDKGLLILDGQVPDLGPFVLPGNNYHVYDYALFWGSIERDYLRRTAVSWPAP
jgi:hypothetical protein